MLIASAVLRYTLSFNVSPVLLQQTSRTVRKYSSNQIKNKKLHELLSSMPKKVDVKGLQDIRLARREKIRKYPPSTVYLQVLGSGAAGAPKALYVFTEQARYLFNCGEGTQRLANEHKVKLGMMEHILITHKSWTNVGGLPGVLLTLQDTGVPQMTLHGPPGIASLYDDTRHFIRFRDMHLNYHHYAKDDGTFGTGNDPLIIQSIPIWAKESASVEKEDMEATSEGMEVEDLYAHEKPWLKKMLRYGSEASPEERLKKLAESKECRNLALAYICRPPPKSGALLLEKCVRAGVPPGPLLGDLKRGQNVTLPNGKVVLAAEVTEADDPGPIFIVVEAPTELYLDSLLENPIFSKYQATATCDGDLTDVVIHFTPSRVMENPRYREWMSRFSPSTNHLVLNDSSVCMGSEAVHRIQYKLNLLCDRLFPLLKDKSIPLKEPKNIENGLKNIENSGSQDCDILTEQSPGNDDAVLEKNGSTVVKSDVIIGPVQQAVTLWTYHIRPKKKLDRSSGLMLTPETYIEECYASESFEAALADAKSKLQLSENSIETVDTSASYPYITFLGTGSCIPNKTRNTSGILLNLSADKTMLMDCGEGTYGQLVRLLGINGSDEVLRHLGAVYVSHLHADHHIGFIRLVLARRKAFEKAGIESVPKFLLLAPEKIIAYLSSYHTNFEQILNDFTLVPNQRFLHEDFKSGSDVYTNICSQLDMENVEMTYVIHCPSSFGIACTHNDGWKLAYSGDTMPCEDFVKIGQGCDLLIHEATMEDELEEDARIKTHSTTSQAIQVGLSMNARHILLTHFSQRYAKVPLLQADVPENVGIAFDNMKVCLRNIPTLHHMYKALVAMFAEDYDEMVEKTAKKRAAREQLKNQVNEVLKKNKDIENHRKKQKIETLS